MEIIFILFILVVLFASVNNEESIIIVNGKRSAKRKGEIGEYRVEKELNLLPKDKYRVIHNVLLKTDKFSSQIDHIVVSIYGIFVIETKHYSGWIFGNEKFNFWTQIIYQSKTQFRNPIKQNWSHVSTLKRVLYKHRHIPYYPIIIFAGDNVQLKNIESQVPVIYEWEITPFIEKYTEPILSIDTVTNITDRINKLNKKDLKSHQEHIETVKKRLNL